MFTSTIRPHFETLVSPSLQANQVKKTVASHPVRFSGEFAGDAYYKLDDSLVADLNRAKHQQLLSILKAEFFPITESNTACEILDGPSAEDRFSEFRELMDDPDFFKPEDVEIFLIQLKPSGKKYKVEFIKPGFRSAFSVKPVRLEASKLEETRSRPLNIPILEYVYHYPMDRRSLSIDMTGEHGSVHINSAKKEPNNGYENFDELTAAVEDFGESLEAMIRAAQSSPREKMLIFP